MATSMEHDAFDMVDMVDMVAAVGNEIKCPICWEEFEEPKSLPNCAHNVCQHCLQGMVKKKSDAIECPVCRVESIVPMGGVAAFPKNYLLVRLIERTPGRKKKKIIREAVKKSKEEIDAAKNAIEEMEERFKTFKSRDEETKRRIKSLTEVVVTEIRKQEQDLLFQMKTRQNQNEKLFQSLKSNVLELCGGASDCIQNVESLLADGKLEDLKSVDVEHLNNVSKSLQMCASNVNCEFTKQFSVSLTNTDSVKKFIADGCLLGELITNNGTGGGSHRGTDYSTCGSVIQTLDSLSCQQGEFVPFAMAVSRNSGQLVVLDERSNRVHIFSEGGKHLHKFRIKFGDLWDIAVSSDDEIVVVNRENNRLLHYDMSGNFKTKFFTAPQEKNIKFSALSVDILGRFIITSCPCDAYDETRDDVTPCILVYSPSGNLILSFGEESLLSPEKAVFLDGKFYVTDYEHDCVLVFDVSGRILQRVRGCQLNSPCGIDADHVKQNLVICNQKNNTVHFYSKSGLPLHHFKTAHRPIQVAFTKNFENVWICCKTDDNNFCLQKVTCF